MNSSLPLAAPPEPKFQLSPAIAAFATDSADTANIFASTISFFA
jgi:hypothetical protein